MLNLFHVNVYAVPDDLKSAQTIELRKETFQALRTADGAPPTFTAYLPLTFEQALDALTHIPRLDAEPDGFFVVAGDHDGQRWQVDGHLFDFDDRLHRVELHGDCPSETFDAILACIGWPKTPLAFELVREGVALDEPSFRRWARARES